MNVEHTERRLVGFLCTRSQGRSNVRPDIGRGRCDAKLRHQLDSNPIGGTGRSARSSFIDHRSFDRGSWTIHQQNSVGPPRQYAGLAVEEGYARSD